MFCFTLEELPCRDVIVNRLVDLRAIIHIVLARKIFTRQSRTASPALPTSNFFFKGVSRSGQLPQGSWIFWSSKPLRWKLGLAACPPTVWTVSAKAPCFLFNDVIFARSRGLAWAMIKMYISVIESQSFRFVRARPSNGLFCGRSSSGLKMTELGPCLKRPFIYM